MVANYITGEVSGDGDGSTGAVGPAGPTGPTGPSGPSGAVGAAGSSVVWRADWSQTTTYTANDVVAFNVPGPSYGYGAGEYSGIYIMREGYTTQGTYPPVGGGWQLVMPQITGATGPAGATGEAGAVGGSGPQGEPGPVMNSDHHSTLPVSHDHKDRHARRLGQLHALRDVHHDGELHIRVGGYVPL